ncbi:MAG: hypothetical protein ACRDLR_06550 [Gaiellaceae bacterium]
MTDETWTLGMMIDVVEREIRQRHSVYPRLVVAGKMSQKNADLQIAGMNAVLATLQRLRAS